LRLGLRFRLWLGLDDGPGRGRREHMGLVDRGDMLVDVDFRNRRVEGGPQRTLAQRNPVMLLTPPDMILRREFTRRETGLDLSFAERAELLVVAMYKNIHVSGLTDSCAC
jgi:hypothetical protein